MGTQLSGWGGTVSLQQARLSRHGSGNITWFKACACVAYSHFNDTMPLKSWVEVPSFLPPLCVTWGKSFSFSALHFYDFLYWMGVMSINILKTYIKGAWILQ